MNYYVLDSVEVEENVATGYKNGKSAEIFFCSADDTEAELENQGFAKCDAPNCDQTMLIEESAWLYLISK